MALVVSETRLPGFNGIALCELLRRDVATHHVPFVFVTADVQPATLATAARAGSDVVLTKPCLPDQLLDGIRAAIDRARLQQKEALLPQHEVQEHVAIAPAAIEPTSRRKGSLRKAHRRGATINPPHAPRLLRCPQCDDTMQYLQSHIGGVSGKHPEQWDHLECRRCGGRFEYRVRTKKLRKVDDAVSERFRD